MFKILLTIALIGISAFAVMWYLKAREEAKDEGIISDEYIENNEEDKEDE